MRRLYPILVFLMLVAGYSSASVIRMGVSLDSPEIASGSEVTLNFSLTNSGDEAARDVQVTLLLPQGFSSEAVYVGTLTPGVPFFGLFNVTIADSVSPGTYPIVVKTHYTDANSYPFSTVSPNYIRYKKPAPTMLWGEIDEVKLTGKGEQQLNLRISNLDLQPHKVLITLYMPDELKAGYYSTELDVAAQGVVSVKVPLKTFGALPGSTYVVFAAMEYNGASHYGSIAQGTVMVLPPDETGMPPWMPLVGLGVLVLAFVYFQFLRPHKASEPVMPPKRKKRVAVEK